MYLTELTVINRNKTDKTLRRQYKFVACDSKQHLLFYRC